MACASLNALCLYLEKYFNLKLEGDVHLTYHYSRDHMSIDALTCKALNLFPVASHDFGAMSDQFCLLNMFKPKTSVGKKCLRRRVFSPCSNTKKINSWYDYLDTLLALRPNNVEELRNHLKQVASIDVALGQLNFQVRCLIQEFH